MINRIPTKEERERFGLSIDAKLFTHEEFVQFLRFMDIRIENIQAKLRESEIQPDRERLLREEKRTLLSVKELILYVWRGRIR